MKQTQTHAHKIDLTEIEGNGDFSCPGCGAEISPDDETDEVYSILEPRVGSHGLEELVIRCNRCSSDIHLTGFSLLQEMPETTKEDLEGGKKGNLSATLLTYEVVFVVIGGADRYWIRF